jgi:2-phosphosulfolactate phosphatase
MAKSEIQTCFSPALFELYKDQQAIVVVVDILRATSAICTALQHGVKKMIPVAGIEEARRYQSMGFLAACERDAVKQDGFDFGNSPFSYMDESIEGKTIAISTTNGTQAIEAAKGADCIVIGSFLNITALTNWLISQEKKVVILCAGWKNRYNMEDALFAGALSRNLLESNLFDTHCDSTLTSCYLFERAGDDLYAFLENSSHRKRLSDLHLEHDIRFCLSYDYTSQIPVLEGEGLVSMVSDPVELQSGRTG